MYLTPEHRARRPHHRDLFGARSLDRTRGDVYLSPFGILNRFRSHGRRIIFLASAITQKIHRRRCSPLMLVLHGRTFSSVSLYDRAERLTFDHGMTRHSFELNISALAAGIDAASSPNITIVSVLRLLGTVVTPESAHHLHPKSPKISML